MSSVSVLHAPRDQALGEKIEAALSREGHAATCLGSNAPGGDLALDGRPAIVIWSAAAAKLARLHDQAREALAHGALIPVAVGGAEPPCGFEKLPPVDLSGWGGDINDPRWRFVLEEINLATHGAMLEDGSVWAEAAPAAASQTASDSEYEAIPEEDEWEHSRGAEAPEVVTASTAFEHVPSQIAAAGKKTLFKPGHVVFGGVFALILVTAGAALLAPRLLSTPGQLDAAPAAIAEAPVELNAGSDEAPGTLAYVKPVTPVEDTPSTASDFEVNVDRGNDMALIVTNNDEGAAEAFEVASVVDTAPKEIVTPLDPAGAATPLENNIAAADTADDAAAAIVSELPDGALPDNDAMENLVAAVTTAPESVMTDTDLPSLPEDITEHVYLGNYFKECVDCPDMAALPAGTFAMGSPIGEPARKATEGPVTDIELANGFAIGTREVTFEQWDACVDDGGCRTHHPSDLGWGRKDRPVVNVSYEDAQSYVAWLAQKTGQPYRLPSEAEWEYAARAGSAAPLAFGDRTSASKANYNGEYPYRGGKGAFRGRTTPVASFPPNEFGLFDMHGNAWEWTADCWADSHAGAPSGGAPRGGDCTARVMKGGAWNTGGWRLRAGHRVAKVQTSREFDIGFRVARDLD